MLWLKIIFPITAWHESTATCTLPLASEFLSAVIVSVAPNCKWKPRGHIWVPVSCASPYLLICTVCQKEMFVGTKRKSSEHQVKNKKKGKKKRQLEYDKLYFILIPRRQRMSFILLAAEVVNWNYVLNISSSPSSFRDFRPTLSPHLCPRSLLLLLDLGPGLD